VTAGRFDLAHNLLSISDYCVQRLAFDENGGKIWLPLGTYFDVQGLDTERRFSLIEKGVMKSAVARVAGTGQLANTNGFTVLNDLVTISGGKHEIR
jgi:hypothetical protein